MTMTSTSGTFPATRTYGDARAAARRGLAEADQALAEIRQELGRIDADRAALDRDAAVTQLELANLWYGQLAEPTVAEARRLADVLSSSAIRRALDDYEHVLARLENDRAAAERTVAELRDRLAAERACEPELRAEADRLKGHLDAADATDAFARLRERYDAGEFRAVDRGEPSMWYWAAVIALAPLLLVSVVYALVEARHRREQRQAFGEGVRVFEGISADSLTAYFDAYAVMHRRREQVVRELGAAPRTADALGAMESAATEAAERLANQRASLPAKIRRALEGHFGQPAAAVLYTRSEVIRWPTKALRRAGLRLILINEQRADLTRLRQPLEAEARPINEFKAKVGEVVGIWDKYSRRRGGKTKRDSDPAPKNFAPWLEGVPAGLRQRVGRTSQKVRRAHGAYVRRGYDVPREHYIDAILDCVDCLVQELGPDFVIDTALESYGIAVNVTERAIGLADRAGHAAADLAANAARQLGELLERPVFVDQLAGAKGGDLKAAGDFMPGVKEYGVDAKDYALADLGPLMGALPNDADPVGAEAYAADDASQPDLGADLTDGS